MPEEIWRPIKRYKGRYEVSNLGNVRYACRTIVGNDGQRKQIRNEEVFKHQTSNTGEPYVLLFDGIKYHRELVKLLVSDHFIKVS